MQHYEIVTDVESWKTWALNHEISEKVIAFLNYTPYKLNTFDPVNGSCDILFATPRSWSYVSIFIKIYDNCVAKAFNQIAGTIGIGLATELKAIDAVFSELPKIEEIWADDDFTKWHKDTKTRLDI